MYPKSLLYQFHDASDAAIAPTCDDTHNWDDCDDFVALTNLNYSCAAWTSSGAAKTTTALRANKEQPRACLFWAISTTGLLPTLHPT